MNIQDLPFLPPYFDRYITQIPEDLDLQDAFERFAPEKIFGDAELVRLGDRVYAPGKWTVKDILQHCIDTERIMTYRALCISRGETVSLPGFDENLYAENTVAAGRTVEDLLEEYKTVRQATRMLFQHMSEVMILKAGTANNAPITPLALAFLVLGHAVHHKAVLVERYYPLLG
ncbi:MAG: DinB family protein [Leadbetterella sp.]|nr:DinB family protein [Leadbetterella sp.]